MTNVFISYRRTDTTSGYASWIYDRLAATHGAEHVFMDLDSLPLGVDFVEHVQRALASTDVTLVLIGPHWLAAVDSSGRRRLDDPGDFVRIEVSAALHSSNRVIPVLIDGAPMPIAEDLPTELQPLTRRQALSFHRQGGAAINELLATIEEVARGRGAGPGGPRPAAPPAVPVPPPQSRSRRRRLPLLLGAAAVLAVAVAAALIASGGSSSRHRNAANTTPRTGPQTTPTAPTPTTRSTTTGPPLGPQLTATQLTPVLVPQAAFQKLLPDFYPSVDQDSSSYALHGGLPALNLCNAPIPATGLGADTSTAYRAIAYGVRPTIYFGSDAGSFAGQGALQFVTAVNQQASACGWRSLPGPPLDDQVVRLTSDQQSPDGDTLHNDVILVRDRSCVVEVTTATSSGTHSSDAETLADSAAQRLTQAVAAG